MSFHASSQLPSCLLNFTWRRGGSIIKGSHLEIMKKGKIPVFVALGVAGRTCYCYFLTALYNGSSDFKLSDTCSKCPLVMKVMLCHANE